VINAQRKRKIKKGNKREIKGKLWRKNKIGNK
jgi:hypothetical protein